jgi:hypothetical protein
MQQLSCRHAFSIYACQTPCYKKIMREITPENAADYLRQTGLVGEEILSVEALGWGVSNLVLRVRTPRQWYVLKQSRPQLRTRELWLSDPERIFREAEAMRAAGHDSACRCGAASPARRSAGLLVAHGTRSAIGPSLERRIARRTD